MVKSLAASIHGYRLHYWRYGKDTEKLVAEALEREIWSPEKWNTWQEEHLAEILEKEATQVPF